MPSRPPSPTPDIQGTVTAILTETAPTPTPTPNIKATETIERIISATAVARAKAYATVLTPTPQPTPTMAELTRVVDSIVDCINSNAEAADHLIQYLGAVWKGHGGSKETAQQLFSDMFSDKELLLSVLATERTPGDMALLDFASDMCPSLNDH